MRSGAFVLVVAAALAWSGPPEGVAAAEASLERVVLLRSADRFSVAVEMSAEPEKVVTREVGDTTLEVEIGPVAGDVAPRELRPPGGLEQIRDVVVRAFDAGEGSMFVRVRVSLHSPAGSHVRIVGRRVYIDFAATGAAQRPEPPAAAAPTNGAALPRSQPPVAPARSYADTVSPAVARLVEIEPFLLSAVGSPTPDVLAALASSLDAVYASLQAVSVPGPSVSTHGRLTTAVLTARRAVEPAFGGDRLAEAHKAMALLEATKAEIPTGSAR
jgi:hypothetical protein